MLRIPLLLASNPKALAKGGPVVQLSAGRWHKVTVGIVDTIVALVLPSSSFEILKDYVTGPCSIQAIIITPGKESSISVYMELMEDA